MPLRLAFSLCLAASCLAVLPASADVTVSGSGAARPSPSTDIAALLGAEHRVMQRMPQARLASLAAGPKSESRARRTKARTAPDQPVMRHDAAWLGAQPAPSGGADWQCLTKALYFEARGETLPGQFAVAEVILNRVDSPAYPDTVCAVVAQGNANGCQFSFVCDGNADGMRDAAAIDRAGLVARAMLDGATRTLTGGATHFHTRTVAPSWATVFPRTAQIGAHLFYRQPTGS